MNPDSPSFTYKRWRESQDRSSQAKKKVRTLEQLWSVAPVRERVVTQQAERPHAIDDDSILVVDLFSGCGGFSCGAEAAGHRVVLAVDCDRAALAYHAVNHRGCKHVRMVLGSAVEERLIQMIREVVPEGRRWHLHGSPPCQLLSSMRNVKKGRDDTGGMQMVQWYLGFVKRARPTTWSFEEVNIPCLRDYLKEEKIAHACFKFVKYGVPQTRKRILAGSGHLIRKMRTDPSNLVSVPVTARDVLTPPTNAALIRGSAGKCIPKYYKSIDEPTWAILCACKPVYADANRKTLRVMTVRELLQLQTFPRSYRMPSTIVLGSEADRVRLVGNAVPPLIARKLLSALH